MRRMMVVLLGVFGAVASFGATEVDDYYSFPFTGTTDIKDARVMLERFCTENNCKVISAVGTNLECKVGDGKAVFVLDDKVNGRLWYSGGRYLKYDAEGRLVAVGRRFGDNAEFNSVREKYRDEAREKWAKRHGMTLEEANVGYDKWVVEQRNMGCNGPRPRVPARQKAKAETGKLKAEMERRNGTEDESVAEQEKAQCEAEREEQSQQLKAIQEELKRYREAKAAEKAKAESK